MMAALFWLALGVILTLTFERYLPFNWLAGGGLKKKEGEEEEFEGKNPDSTKRVKDEILQAAFPIQEVKLVMVVREDLKMGKGKIGAQCGHATIAAFEQVTAYAKKSAYWKKVLNNWSWEGQKKVCVKVMTEQEL